MYRSIRPSINALGVLAEYAAPGVHEKKAEAAVKLLRYRLSVLLNSVQFEVPSSFYPRMLEDLAITHNMLPTRRSAPLTPTRS